MAINRYCCTYGDKPSVLQMYVCGHIAAGAKTSEDGKGYPYLLGSQFPQIFKAQFAISPPVHTS